jgi:hypothetical protein
VRQTKVAQCSKVPHAACRTFQCQVRSLDGTQCGEGPSSAPAKQEEGLHLLVAAHSSAKETLAANVTKNSVLPFHRGAVRYYKEIGVALPDDLTKAG